MLWKKQLKIKMHFWPKILFVQKINVRNKASNFYLIFEFLKGVS